MQKAFYTHLGILSAICGAILAGLKYGLSFYEGPQIWYALLFFIVLTVFSYSYVASAKKQDNNFFVKRFFITMGLRLIFCIIFLVIYMISRPEREPIFVLTFMILYLFYTMFEIYYLVSKLRREN